MSDENEKKDKLNSIRNFNIGVIGNNNHSKRTLTYAIKKIIESNNDYSDNNSYDLKFDVLNMKDDILSKKKMKKRCT